jgi:hypothetical protein
MEEYILAFMHPLLGYRRQFGPAGCIELHMNRREWSVLLSSESMHDTIMYERKWESAVDFLCACSYARTLTDWRNMRGHSKDRERIEVTRLARLELS